jgi:Zn-finger nucleic acid-binding protein
MADAMDERRRALEEEYFHRKNKEAIEKLRAKMRLAEQAKESGVSSMKCPRCEPGMLKEVFIDEIPVDTCDNCAGVWLDSGELEKLTQTDIARWFRNLLGAEEEE